jgi:putative oligomerization/nucleic acid binding protein
MRGRWASAAIGAGIARNRAQGRAEQEVNAANQANQVEMEKMKANYQHEIDQMKASQAQAQAAPQPQQPAEDPMVKLKKLADLKQQGILSEEEFQKMKASLISQL